MSGIPLDKAGLLALLIESIIWGFFLASFGITLFFLFHKKHDWSKNAPYAAFVSLLFILSTLHVGLSFTRILHAFFASPSPILYLQDITNSLFRFKYGVLFFQIFLGDILIISRCFLLWNKNYLILIGPAVMAAGTLASAAGALHGMVAIQNTGITSNDQVDDWITASYTLAMANKLVCLVLVALRVRQIHSLITKNVNRHVTVYTLLVVLVESGFCALVTSVVLVPTFTANSNAHYIVCDALSPITGLTVAAIIAGITANLSNPAPPLQLPQTPTRPGWNRYSISHPVRSPVSPRGPKGQWNDSDDDIPPSPPLPAAHHLNKSQSSGTLNTAIVL